jgi:hypothetical protein
MNMVYCRSCGTQLAAAALACSGCGTAQPGIPAAAAGSGEGGQAPGPAWQHKFQLIDKAGGPKLPKLWSLPAKEVAAIKLNGWAFLFGPFYYAAKGMWKKGLSLLGLTLAILFGGALVLEAMGISPDLLLLVGPAIFMGQANVSYYRRVKEGINRWW